MPAYGQSVIAARLRALVPVNWFPSGPSPVLDTWLAGPAAALSWAQGLLWYARQQMRLQTASGGFLDLTAYDYFGPNLPRNSGETDAAYTARIQANLLQARNTRYAIIQVLTQLTGRVPIVFEPMRQLDCGGWNTGYLGWSTTGKWGSLANPYQCWVTAYRPLPSGGIPNQQGWSNIASIVIGLGGWASRQMGWVSQNSGSSIVSDADIYAAVAGCVPAGFIAWTYISN